MYHLPGNVISSTVGLVYKPCLPAARMSFLAQLVSDNSGSLEKLELGTVLPSHPLRKMHGIRVVRDYQRLRFDLPSSNNFRDIMRFPQNVIDRQTNFKD